jgi:membrane protein YdbS with pleckstrin-like domain
VGEDKRPASGPFEWVFHASLLLLGAVITLNVTVAFLRPLLPWIAGGIALATVVGTAVMVIRWRRSKW